MSKREPTTKELIAAELLLGRFTKAVLKPKATGPKVREGDKLAEWMEPLLTDHYVNEKFADRIHYTYPTAFPLPPPPLKGLKGASSSVERSFIYLDVGAWIGSKNKPWGADTKFPDRFLKRDFGVICGPLVALCTFTYAHAGKHCELWEKNKNRKNEPWKSVAKLVESLSRPATHEVLRHDEPLGSVIVRDAMLAPMSNPVWPGATKDYVIHVLLGDMHVPVLDDVIQSYGVLMQGEPEPALYIKGGPFDLNNVQEVEKTFRVHSENCGELSAR